MTTLFTDGFECPPNAQPSTFNAWSSIIGLPVIVNTPVHDGVYSMQAPNDGAQNITIENLSAAIPDLFVQFFVYFPVALVNNANQCMCVIADTLYANQVAAYAQCFGGVTTWRLIGTASTEVIYVINPLQWYCVEVERDTADGAVRMWIDYVNVIDNAEVVTNNSKNMYCGQCDLTAPNLSYFDSVVIADEYIGPRERRLLKNVGL